MRKVLLLVVIIIITASCVSKKEYANLEAKHKKAKDELVAVKNSLTKCLIEKEKCQNQIANLDNTIAELKKDKEKTEN